MRAFFYSLAPILLLILLFMRSGVAYAQSKPVHSQTLVVGPYAVVVGMSEYPPIVGDAIDVTVKEPSATQLSGQLVAQPGLGTDAIPLHASFAAQSDGTLDATIHLIVKGAWTLVFDLNGPKGQGTASIDVIVSAPGAIAPWLGWTIGLSPLIGCAWLGWWLWNYRRKLIAKRHTNDAENWPHVVA
jgi:hypothetical protein